MAASTASVTLNIALTSGKSTSKTFSGIATALMSNDNQAKDFANGYIKIVDGTLSGLKRTTTTPVDLGGE